MSPTQFEPVCVQSLHDLGKDLDTCLRIKEDSNTYFAVDRYKDRDRMEFPT